MFETFGKLREYSLGLLFLLLRNRIKTVPNRILFFTFQGSYTCNPKYICEEILLRHPNNEVVWVSLDGRGNFPKDIPVVRLGSVSYYKALYSSKILVENAFNYVKRPFKKKTCQVHIQTMHGSLGIKRIDPSSGYSRKRNQKGFKSAADTDYLFSNSDIENMIYRTSFWGGTPILEIGHARTDVLFCNRQEEARIRDRIRHFYGLDPDTRIALYAPTYLSSGSQACEPLDFSGLRNALTQRFGGTWVVMSRMHPRDCRRDLTGSKEDSVLDGNAYEDIQELMVGIDFGVTDYSSWIYDYVLTEKPGAVYAPDLAEYMNTTGLYYPISETPFFCALTNKDLVDGILAFDTDIYHKKVAVFLKEKGCVDDGQSSFRAGEVINDLICCGTLSAKYQAFLVN